MRLGVLIGTALAAPSAFAEEPVQGEAPSPAPDVTPLSLGLAAGYGFRPHPDERSHGGAAALYGDVPIWGGFGARASVLGLGFPGSETAERGLGLGGLALSFLYAVDETDVVALFEAGPLVALGGELADEAAPLDLYAGVLVGLGVRFPIAEGFRVEAALRLPYVAFGPGGFVLPPPLGDARDARFPLQVMATLGLVVEPGAAFEAALEGRDPVSAFLSDLLGS